LREALFFVDGVSFGLAIWLHGIQTITRTSGVVLELARLALKP